MSSSLIIRDRRAILIWLILCLQLVALMVLVGGYTRLSGSGLSITQWKPVHGVIPPYNIEQWQEEFAAYKTTPQYKLINNDMSLEGFKNIFWPEYIHRLLGRIIGIIFFLPLLIFATRKSISKLFFWRMTGILALGGLQGGIGWIMVKSGLQNSPYVNHVKLTLHLSIAFIIFALILWAILDILYNGNSDRKNNPKVILTSKNNHLKIYKFWFSMLCIQIIFGGFMAGSHAGLIYNTWPTMDGKFLPDNLLTKLSLSSNILENIEFIQFTHRTLAIFIAAIFLFWCYLYKEYIRVNHLSIGCILIAITIFVQFILGVITLIYHVPLPIALAHQMVALLLWTMVVWLLYKLNNCINKTEYIKLVK